MITPQTRKTGRFASRGNDYLQHPVIQDEIARGERDEHGILLVESIRMDLAKMTQLLSKQERYEREVAS